MKDYGYSPRVHLASVEIREHAANSAVVKKTRDQVDKGEQWIEDLKSDWKRLRFSLTAAHADRHLSGVVEALGAA